MVSALQLTACSLLLLVFRGSVLSEGRDQADDCTSGFTSVDRIDAVLGNYNIKSFFSLRTFSVQVLLPESYFTCAGNILSWTFSGGWIRSQPIFPTGGIPVFTELQIWRSSGSGSYDKIGSTTINVAEPTATRQYKYPLSSPLAFRAGDILGYFQPSTSTSQLGLYHEEVTTNIYRINSLASPASQFNIDGSIKHRYQPMIDVETDSGCECGFMSVERMRILLKQETVGNAINPAERLQITPDIKFTCDGMITKWIIGANMLNSLSSTLLELQVWRNIGNDTYQKRNGTFITIPTESSNRIYEYDNFSPIPFQAGDILGVFLPQLSTARLGLLSENTDSPTNYYLNTDNTDSEFDYTTSGDTDDSLYDITRGDTDNSLYDIIDLQNTESLMSQDYRPLVSVQIVRISPALTPTRTSTMTSPVTTLTTEEDTLTVYVSAGVSLAVVVLISAAVIVIAVSVCLMKMKNKITCGANDVALAQNDAYAVTDGASDSGVRMKINEAYNNSPLTRNTELKTSVNDAYLAMCELEINEEHVYEPMPA